MDPTYAVYMAGGTRIGRRIIASLVDDHRTAAETLRPARTKRRARRAPFLNPPFRRTDPPCVPSGFPRREGGRA